MKSPSLLPCVLFALAAASLAAPRLWPAAQAQQSESTAKQRREAQIEKLKRAQEEALRKRKQEYVETLRAMQGAWQLIEYRASDLQDPGREDAAYMLVGNEFLSIEIHMGYFDEQHQELSSFIQTGIYRLNFDDEDQLMAMCLIGSVDDGSGLTAPQAPGIVSVYSIRQTPGGSLFLTSEDGSRFEFGRVASGALTDRLYEETDWLPGAKAREKRRAVSETAAK